MRIAVAVIAVGTLLFTAYDKAAAASGDTNIYVHYKTKSVRVRPTPRNGAGFVDFHIVLRPNGTVNDAFAVKDGQKGAHNTKLGKQPRRFVYRIIDGSTIERTAELETHFHKLTVRVTGKNCTADVDFVLKPGQTEFKDYSTELKTMAYFSSLKLDYATCVIE